MRPLDRSLLHRQALTFLILAVLAGTLGCTTHQAATPVPAVEGPLDPLVDLNLSFRRLYAEARASLLSEGSLRDMSGWRTIAITFRRRLVRHECC